MSEGNNLTKKSFKGFFNKKNTIITLMLIVLILLIPISGAIKRQQIKMYDIKLNANMYALLEICDDYRLENITEDEFIKQNKKLMDEYLKLKAPKSEDVSVSKGRYFVKWLDLYEKVYENHSLRILNKSDADVDIREDVKLLKEYMNVLNEEVDKINVNKKVDLNYTKSINEETRKLLEIIRRK